jgi:hypothetical protein
MSCAQLTDEDAALEVRIFYQSLRLRYGKTREERTAAMDELRKLHSQRSNAQVEQMERTRGLR